MLHEASGTHVLFAFCNPRQRHDILGMKYVMLHVANGGAFDSKTFESGHKFVEPHVNFVSTPPDPNFERLVSCIKICEYSISTTRCAGRP